MGKVSLLDDVNAAAETLLQRKTWFEALPESAQQELLDIRARFHAGEFALKRGTVARLIKDSAEKRGWKTADYKRLSEWLAQN